MEGKRDGVSPSNTFLSGTAERTLGRRVARSASSLAPMLSAGGRSEPIRAAAACEINRSGGIESEIEVKAIGSENGGVMCSTAGCIAQKTLMYKAWICTKWEYRVDNSSL